MMNGMIMEKKSTVLNNLPNHVNNQHVHIFRWLDGCGWSINCGNIHIEDNDLEGAISKFLKVVNGLDVIHEYVGFGLVGEIGTINERVEKSYFY